MKRLIFDLDNTLIKWKSEYTSALEKTIEQFKLDVDYHIIDAIIEEQEDIHDTMNKEVLLNDINNKVQLNLGIEFIDTLFENQKELAEIDNEMIETLEYLKNKYDMVVLTNYFKVPQEGRLKKAKIDKYFSQVIAGDEVLIKPRIEAFEKAIGNYNLEDVTMIGDSIEHDIKGALNAKINVIQVDYFNKYEDTKDYPIIRKFSDLKKYL